MAKLVIAIQASPFPFAVLALAHHINERLPNAVEVQLVPGSTLPSDSKTCVSLTKDDQTYNTLEQILENLAKWFPNDLQALDQNDKSAEKLTLLLQQLQSSQFKQLEQTLKQLDQHLLLRSYYGGFELGLFDFAIWGSLKASPIYARLRKIDDGSLPCLSRYYSYISGLRPMASSFSHLQQAQSAVNKDKKDQGSFDIALPGAEMGKVVTRMPPEPSGYLHIGHAKAALLNQYFSQTYRGKLIIRFDDTNPSKEKEEFEESIKEDLRLIGVEGDLITHTSDYFNQLFDEAKRLITLGFAYADDTDQQTMRDERMRGIASKCRDNPVEISLEKFEEMVRGTEEGQRYCIRAKMSVDDPNKALRDPVIYRCNLTPHHRTGSTWKIYPTYDFACPLVDSLEGVTHALRTNEYRDRNPQYHWFQEKLGIRKVHVWDYSRINFVYTLLSKRKLQWFVTEGLVTGWDDPRFPTVRGIIRRGLTIEALKQYILMQGASQNALLLEWDKLWSLNKKVIDPVAPRFVALDQENICTVHINGAPAEPFFKDMPRHKKNTAVGTKQTVFAADIFLEQADAAQLQQGEEITLMDWGNAFVESVQKEGDVVKHVELKLHLEGDFKKTQKKLTWLASMSERSLVSAELLDYDYLITKKKLDEEDDLNSFITPVTEFKTPVLVDNNVSSLKKGDIIQLERKGYYRVDSQAPNLKFIRIPDGKAASITSKAQQVQK